MHVLRTFSIYAMVALGCLMATPAMPQQGDSLVGHFRRGDAGVKERTLRDVITAKLSPSADELQGLIAAALSDPASTVRAAGLMTVLAVTTGSRYEQSSEIRAREGRYHDTILRLLPAIADRLQDQDERVRRNAVIAFGSASLLRNEYEAGRLVLEDRALGTYTRRFESETSDVVKGEIMKSAALADGNGDLRARLFRLGLEDSSPDVLQYAVRGAGTLRMTELLPRLPSLLHNEDRGVRIATALALQNYEKATLVSVVSVLREALSTEKDPSVKTTLEATVTLVER